MLFRFVEYNYSNYEENKYKNPNFICEFKTENNAFWVNIWCCAL